jgi:hypothetical protein
MSTHAVDSNDERRVRARSDVDAILILLAMPRKRYFR